MRRLIATAAAAAALMLLLFAQQAFAQTFSFANQSSYVDETHIMHVLGEVKNDSGTAVKDVLITASFYAKNGTLLAQNHVPSKIRVINSGSLAPFDVSYYDPKTVDMVANYTLSATGNSTDAKPVAIRILSTQSRLDVLGVYFINVSARNDGDQTATNPGVVATLYDKGGRVIAIGEALAEGGDRVTEMEPGQEAGFGIAVAERLQTYKAVRYSIVADSDQYLSNVTTLAAAGLGANANTNLSNSTKSGCLIATAAFESELAPQVQALRDFRDGIALKTMAGSSFMNVFNGWYYSFSPQVADYERDAPWLKSTVRASIYPLLGILDLSTSIYSLGGNGEAGIVGAGLAASSLIGLLYFAPLTAVLIVANRKKQWKMTRAKYVLIAAWAMSLAAIAAGEASTVSGVLMFGTALLVLSAISTVILALVRAARW
jgi:peptide/nickel transport system substrate-binding protein